MYIAGRVRPLWAPQIWSGCGPGGRAAVVSSGSPRTRACAARLVGAGSCCHPPCLARSAPVSPGVVPSGRRRPECC
eukprot:6487360-Pyramimonas_sp.AAC.1